MSVKYHVGVVSSPPDKSKSYTLGEKTAAEILTAIAAGDLTTADKVWQPGWDAWRTIAETPELRAHSTAQLQGPEWFKKPSLSSFWQTFQTILLKPSNFAHLEEAPRLTRSFTYLLIAILLSSTVTAGVLMLSGLQFGGLTSLTLAGLFFGLAIMGSLLLSTLFTLLTHWVVRIAGARQPLRTTFATLLPCQGVGILLSIIPVAGLFLSLWPFISGIIALAGSQRISILKSALVQIGVVFLATFALMVLVMIPVIALIAISR